MRENVCTHIHRLSKYCEEIKSAIPTDVDMFKRFTDYTDEIASVRRVCAEVVTHRSL